MIQATAIAIGESAERAAGHAAPAGGRARRRDLIRQIEAARKSRVVTYVCSDRPGLAAQVAEDAVRPLYDVVRQIGRVEHIDLFLYSRGGAVEVPWRIVSMLREHCRRLGAIVPFRAYSAATLITLGCDEIVMGPKAELGPIDPAVRRRATQEDGAVSDEEIHVEDVMTFVAFLKEQSAVFGEATLADQLRLLTERLSPWTLGKIWRTHNHIRVVAQKLLAARADPPDEPQAHRIVEALIERTGSHDHAITRREALDMGLPVRAADPVLEAAAWTLLEEYERLLETLRPVDANELLGRAADDAELPQTVAIIDSTQATWACRGLLKLQRVRQPPQQINLNINLGLTLPERVTEQSLPRGFVERLASQLRGELPALVRDQLREQCPAVRVDARLQATQWRDVTAEAA